MNSVLDNSLVGLALLVSGGYAVASLGPKSVRRRLLAAMARATARAPRYLGLRRISARLDAASGKVQGACGGCDSCGSDQAPAGKSAENSPPAEVSVPVAKIGRR
jgi:hypothetical protein